MISTKASLLFRLLPRTQHHVPRHYPSLNAAPCNSTYRLHEFHSCCLSSIQVMQKPKPISVAAGPNIVPRRFLAGGGNQENYILHENSLTEAEKNELDDSVKKDFEDWIPYGYDPTNKDEDIYRHKMFLFTTITIGIVVFMYFIVHAPPRNRREWVTREAYLELERRQRLGLPLVDRDLIPADQVLLPSLEELGDDYDIII